MTVNSGGAGNQTQRLRQALDADYDGLEDGRNPRPGAADAAQVGPFDETVGLLLNRVGPDGPEAPIAELRWLPARPAASPVDAATSDRWPLHERGVIGDYELLGEIARGGVGIVFRARQRGLDRPVALKVLRAGANAIPADARRFRNEAETVAQLDHPNIVPIFEVGEDRGCSFFSMRLIEGGNLSDRGEETARDPKRGAGLLAAVARAIQHAHERGVLHRDLKPSNVLLDEYGKPQVVDFGLARRVNVDHDLTRTGVVLGTPAYMAPEQAGGLKGAVTTATDVHGLGALLYFLLTGRAPYAAASAHDALDRVRARPPRAIDRAIDRDLETICLKCLEEDPATRYPSAASVADDLEALAGGTTDPRPPGRAIRASLALLPPATRPGALGDRRDPAGRHGDRGTPRQ